MGFGVNRFKLLYIEQINIKVLLYSTGNYIRYPVRNQSGKEKIKETSIGICWGLFPFWGDSMLCCSLSALENRPEGTG